MSKGFKTFLKILYYVFTFGLGVLLAFVLPGIYTYDNLVKEMDASLASKEYAKAMNLIGGYYDADYAFSKDFDDGSSIVLFRAATLFDAQEEANQPYLMKICYAGFLYNVKENYKVSKSTDNQTVLEVLDANKKAYEIELLNHDSNADSKNDTISTLVTYNYVYFEIPNTITSSISKISFLDEDKNLFKSVDINLDFTNVFFESVSEFVIEYNKNSGSDKLSKLDEEFRSKNENYLMGNYGYIESSSTRKAVIVIVVYFAWIYILGDFLVGKHYIWLLIKRIYYKIKHIDQVNSDDVYGTDYYTKLTFSLVVPDGCNDSFTITYHNELSEIELLLNYDNGYKVTQRVHAGKYVNAWLECGDYETIDLPKEFIIKGYTMDVTVNVRKKTNNTFVEENYGNQN